MKTLFMATLVVALASSAHAQVPVERPDPGVSFVQAKPAQKPAPPPAAKPAAQKQAPDMFPSKAACEAALASGNFSYYVPKFTGRRDENPLGPNDVVVPLEADMCINLFTTVGMRHVVQKKGDMYRAHKRADGGLTLFARDDCGNKCDPLELPGPKPVPPTTPASTPTLPATPNKLDLNVRFDGKLEVVHSGTIEHKHTYEKPEAPTPRKRSWVKPLTWGGIGTAIVVGTILALKDGSSAYGVASVTNK